MVESGLRNWNFYTPVQFMAVLPSRHFCKIAAILQPKHGEDHTSDVGTIHQILKTESHIKMKFFLGTQPGE